MAAAATRADREYDAAAAAMGKKAASATAIAGATEMADREDAAAAPLAEGTPERKAAVLKKRRKSKRKQERRASAADTDMVDESGDGKGAPGDADVITSPANGHDPNRPEANDVQDTVGEEEGNKDSSVGRKRRRKRAGRRGKNNGTNATSSAHNSSLQPTNDEADLLTMADENNTPDFECKKSKKRKRKRNRVGVTEAHLQLLNNVSPAAEREVVGGIGGSTGKIDHEIQHDVSEEECRSSLLSHNNSKGNELKEKQIACSSTDYDHTCAGPSSLGKARKKKVCHIYSPRGSLVRFQRKKLLILDLNGLLADINQDHHNAHMSHARVRGKLVFRRPHCDNFLRFCFQNFEIGIWSSRMKSNVDTVVDILMKDLKKCVLFCWDLSKCTATGCKTLENSQKPLVLKELKKLWNNEEGDLPLKQGEFSPSNTLLVDDSPYKALSNPPHTAIFPHPYSYHNKEDKSLGPGGDLRVYLENLATADDVQCYVREHPFGQPSITDSDPCWSFYVQILDKLGKPNSVLSPN